MYNNAIKQYDYACSCSMFRSMIIFTYIVFYYFNQNQYQALLCILDCMAQLRDLPFDVEDAILTRAIRAFTKASTASQKQKRKIFCMIYRNIVFISVFNPGYPVFIRIEIRACVCEMTCHFSVSLNVADLINYFCTLVIDMGK